MTKFFRLGVMVFAVLFASTAFAGSSVKIKVKVKQTKVNGKSWDAFGNAPDIAMCIDGDDGMQCYPKGDSPRKVREPQCRDSYECTFRNVKVPDGEFEIILIDIDAMANDIIGEEDCKPKGKCKVGRAKVTIK